MNSHAAEIQERVSTLKRRMSSKRMNACTLFSDIRNNHKSDTACKNQIDAKRGTSSSPDEVQ